MGTTWRRVKRERRDAQLAGGRVFLIILMAGLAALAGRYLLQRDEQPAAGVPQPAAVVTPVYQCISDGKLVLSERPCGQRDRLTH